jgi:phage terminase Nu1 subunit (DNA packaging protein)
MAALYGVSLVTIADWTKRGILVKLGHGSYDPKAGIRGVYEHFKKIATGKAGGEKAVQSAAQERPRLAKEQADKFAIGNAQARRELLVAVDVLRRHPGRGSANPHAGRSVPAEVRRLRPFQDRPNPARLAAGNHGRPRD